MGETLYQQIRWKVIDKDAWCHTFPHTWTYIHTHMHSYYTCTTEREMEPGKTSEKWSSHQGSANHTSVGGYSHGLLSELSSLKSQLGTCVLWLPCDTQLRTRSPHQWAECHLCVPSSIGFPVSRTVRNKYFKITSSTYMVMCSNWIWIKAESLSRVENWL